MPTYLTWNICQISPKCFIIFSYTVSLLCHIFSHKERGKISENCLMLKNCYNCPFKKIIFWFLKILLNISNNILIFSHVIIMGKTIAIANQSTLFPFIWVLIALSSYTHEDENVVSKRTKVRKNWREFYYAGRTSDKESMARIKIL
jgi:hypothetical protein